MAAPTSDIDWSGWAQMAVALGALTFAWYEARQNRLDRQQQRKDEAADLRLRARPRVEGNWHFNRPESAIWLGIRNVGLGPAVISTVRYSYDDVQIDEIDEILLDKIVASGDLGLRAHLKSRARILHPGGILLPGEEHILFRLEGISDDFDYNQMGERFAIELAYESLYGERFDHAL